MILALIAGIFILIAADHKHNSVVLCELTNPLHPLRQIVTDNAVKFDNPHLNHSREMRLKFVGDSIFDGFSQ